MSPDPSVIADYDRWLGAVGIRLLGSSWTEADLQDLKQEGRIAMWRALETYDSTKGALPAWLTTAAEVRMRNVAHGTGQPFGRAATRGSREVDTGPSLDEMTQDRTEALLGFVAEAIHDGEILRTIREVLTPAEQEYVFLRFWCGLDPTSRTPGLRAVIAEFPVLKQRWHWQTAQAKLRTALADQVA